MSRTRHLEILVEEPSMEAFLRNILPSILGETSYMVYTYQGKKQLLDRLPERLRGYSKWLPEDWRIIIIIDRDTDDCKELKQKLDDIAANAGMTTRSRDLAAHQVVNRLAIEELEAWYFGDWQAVKSAFPRVSENVPRRSRYRDPDRIKGGTWEAFERLMQANGYYKSGLRKIEVARKVSEFISPGRNRSRSFQSLRNALSDITS